MRIKNGINTERTNLFKKLMCINVFAEEVSTDNQTQQQNEPVAPETPKQPTVNFEDLIANARSQEKAKLYPQIDKLKEEKNALTEKNNAHLLTIGEKDSEIRELKAKIEKLEKASGEGASEREKTLLAEIDTLKAKIKEMETTVVSREDLESEIRGEYEVKLYREQKLREVGDTVIPELITGSTKEEIDASIEISKKRYEEITNRVIGSVNVPVANTNLSSVHAKDLKIEDIANLDPRSPEYAQLRAKLGLK